MTQVPAGYWLLTREDHEKWIKKFCKQLHEDMLNQYDKGARKRGDVNLFTDERIFGSMPQGSEAYFEFVDVLNYACGFGPEQAKRKEALLKGLSS